MDVLENTCRYSKCRKTITGLRVNLANCHHTYCYTCFVEWFDKTPNCPVDNVETSEIHFCDQTGYVFVSLSSDDVYYDMVCDNLRQEWITIEKSLLEKSTDKLKTLENKLKPIKSYFHHKLLEDDDRHKHNDDHLRDFEKAKLVIKENSAKILDITQEFVQFELDFQSYASVLPSYKDMKHCPARTTLKYLGKCTKMMQNTVHHLTKLTMRMCTKQDALEHKYNEFVKIRLNENDFRSKINHFFKVNCPIAMCEELKMSFDRKFHKKI